LGNAIGSGSEGTELPGWMLNSIGIVTPVACFQEELGSHGL